MVQIGHIHYYEHLEKESFSWCKKDLVSPLTNNWRGQD
jgi:hypothetical protein